MNSWSLNKRRFESIRSQLQKCAWAIEVVDARNIEKTRITSLESKFLDKLFIVATKSDLLEGVAKKNIDLKVPIFYVSSKTKTGISDLKIAIANVCAKKLNSKLPPIDIFIFGIPNVGKSSLINSLLYKNIAKTGFRSGITRGIQWINLDQNCRLVDAPGVLSNSNKSDELSIYSAVDVQHIKNPFSVAKKLILEFLSNNPGELRDYYQIDFSQTDDAQDILELIAMRRKMLLKGGQPDIECATLTLIRDFQKGKIKLI